METKVALIPKVIMKGAMGPKEYGVLLTNQRMIFVLEKASKAAVLGVLGDALLGDKKEVDYQNESMDMLAADEKNVVVPYAGIQKLHLKKGFSSYTMSTAFTLLITFSDSSGRAGSVKAFLQPPLALVQQKKAGGINLKTATEEYAKSARNALEKALPPSAIQKGEWDI